MGELGLDDDMRERAQETRKGEYKPKAVPAEEGAQQQATPSHSGIIKTTSSGAENQAETGLRDREPPGPPELCR